MIKLTSERIKIYKDDKMKYRTILSNKMTVDGEEKTSFMKLPVNFRRGVDLRNKTVIKIKDGFLSFYQNTYTEKGLKKTKMYNKIVVLDYEILEDGDNTLEPSEFKRKDNTNIKGFAPIDDDDLPF